MYLVLSKGGQNNISKLVIVAHYQQHYTAVIGRQFNRYFSKPELLISRTFDFSNNVYNKSRFHLKCRTQLAFTLVRLAFLHLVMKLINRAPFSSKQNLNKNQSHLLTHMSSRLAYMSTVSSIPESFLTGQSESLWSWFCDTRAIENSSMRI